MVLRVDDKVLWGSSWLLVETGPPVNLSTRWVEMFPDVGTVATRERELGIRPGWPILICLFEDDYRLNDYLRRAYKANQKATAHGYAQIIKVWLEYLAVKPRQDGGDGGVRWDEATDSDVSDYHYWRVYDERNPSRISSGTWNTNLTALRHLYDFASSPRTRQGAAPPWVAVNPVEGYTGEKGDRDESSKKRFTEKDARRGDRVHWMTPDQYRLWRDVGFRGYSTVKGDDGSLAASVVVRTRQQNEARNVAMADLTVTSGLRRREFGGLLTMELPDGVGIDAFLPSALTKRGKKRAWTVVNAHGLHSVRRYIAGERMDAIDRARRAGRYDRMQDRIDVIDVVTKKGQAHVVADQWLDPEPVDNITAQDRLRLFKRNDDGQLEPLAVWLKDNGEPMPYTSWYDVFDAASDRLEKQRRKWGLPNTGVNVTPQSLRSTFALMTLVQFCAAIDEGLGRTPADPFEPGIYSEAFDFVADYLSHQSIETTKRSYLPSLLSVRRLSTLQRTSAASLLDDLASLSPTEIGFV